MVDITKGLNSKRFLFTYLIIIGFLLVFWINQLPLLHEDKRQIPADMQEYLESPPRHLPKISLNTNSKQVLTSDYFVGKWSFVYFSHRHCMPACKPSLDMMKSVQSSFSNNDFQFLVVGLDVENNETASNLADFLRQQGFDFDVGSTASLSKLEELTRAFIALFLKTTYTDGSYLIEQEHHTFIVDPKGRVYATFRPPYNIATIQANFLKLRHFYAKTE